MCLHWQNASFSLTIHRLFYTSFLQLVTGCSHWHSKTVNQWRSIISSSIQSLPTGMGSKVQTKNKFQPKNSTSRKEIVTESKPFFFLFKTFKARWNMFEMFGAPTAPRAFELLTRFKRSQFGTDLRQCLCISDSATQSLSFSITPFIPSIFLLTWMGECWLAKTNHMTIQPLYFTDVMSDWKGIRIVPQWNEMIKLMICVGPDTKM